MATTHAIRVQLAAALLDKYQVAVWDAEYRVGLLVVHQAVIYALSDAVARALRLLRDAHYGEDPMALVELDDLLESVATQAVPGDTP